MGNVKAASKAELWVLKLIQRFVKRKIISRISIKLMNIVSEEFNEERN